MSRAADAFLANGTTEAWMDCFAECAAQLDKWGEQNHQSFPSGLARYRIYDFPMAPAGIARRRCEERFKAGRCTWADIALEEIAEAFEEPEHSEDLYVELIQCAAVFVSWAASVRRNRPATPEVA